MVDITNKTWRHRHSRKCVVMNNPSLDPDDHRWDEKLSLIALQGMRRGHPILPKFQVLYLSRRAARDALPAAVPPRHSPWPPFASADRRTGARSGCRTPGRGPARRPSSARRLPPRPRRRTTTRASPAASAARRVRRRAKRRARSAPSEGRPKRRGPTRRSSGPRSWLVAASCS